jgi:sporulation protein YlmC with PRC-barrel domain
MNIDKQALESREGFAKNQWPGMKDGYWGRSGGKQAAAGGAGEQKMNLVRASELVGKDVQDKSGQNVGRVRDVVVGLHEGEVKSIVVAVRDGGEASVPGTAIKASGSDNRLVVGMSADELRAQTRAEQPQRPGTAGSGATLRPSDRPLQPPAAPSK